MVLVGVESNHSKKTCRSAKGYSYCVFAGNVTSAQEIKKVDQKVLELVAKLDNGDLHVGKAVIAYQGICLVIFYVFSNSPTGLQIEGVWPIFSPFFL